MENITHSIAKKNYYTPTQLKNLVQAAQRYEQHAIDKLCEDFKPLIYKEARQHNIHEILGEDALSIAWVIFLELIYKYDKDNFRSFPGYVKKHLHFRLMDILQSKNHFPTCDSLDAHQEFIDIISDKRDFIADKMCSMAFVNAYKTLTKAEQKVLAGVDFSNVSVKQYSQANKCSIQNISKLRLSALRKLKSKL